MTTIDEIRRILWLFSAHESHPWIVEEAQVALKVFGDLINDGLIWALHQNDIDLMLLVLTLLQEFYTDAERALPAVRALILDSEDRLLRVTAMNMLHIMGDRKDELIPLLMPRLESDDEFERLFSAANL